MEKVQVKLDEIARRSRVLLVRHNSTALTRGLEFDEEVVLSDASGDFFAGRVVDVDFEIDDTLYRISVGVRLPEDLAQEWLDRKGWGDVRDGAPGGASQHRARGQRDEDAQRDMDRLLMLLGEARRARSDRSIPAEAAMATLRTLRHSVADL